MSNSSNKFRKIHQRHLKKVAFFYVYTYFLTVGVKIIAYKINQLQKYFHAFVGRIIKYYTIALTKSIKTNQDGNDKNFKKRKHD